MKMTPSPYPSPTRGEGNFQSIFYVIVLSLFYTYLMTIQVALSIPKGLAVGQIFRSILQHEIEKWLILNPYLPGLPFRTLCGF